MAEWRQVALAAFLADGKVDDNEIKVLRKELWKDGKITVDEIKFLVELRNAAQKKARARKESLSPKFEALFFKAVEENLLRDGKVSASEARWLRELLFADGKIDAGEARFMQKVKKTAKSTSPEFNTLYDECMAKVEKAKAAAKAKAKK